MPLAHSYTPGEKTPKQLGPWCGRRRSSPDSGEAGGGAGRGGGVERPGAQHGPTCGGSLAGDVTSERRRRSNGGAAAEARIPVRIGVRLNNVQYG
jgi:hypothetical protein